MSDGHVRAGETAWHGSGAKAGTAEGAPLRTMRICLYLDELSRANGCLRAIRGSHQQPLAGLLEPLQRAGALDGPPDAGTAAALAAATAVAPGGEPGGPGGAGAGVPCTFLESSPGTCILFTEEVRTL
jgi:hypothetical protein